MLVLSYLLLTGCIVDSETSPPLTVTLQLIGLLHDPSQDVRRTAALSLGKIAIPASAPALIEALNDPDPMVRTFSAWALGEIGEEVETNGALALVRLLGDQHIHVKHAAGEALGKIGVRQIIVKLLIDVLMVGGVESRRAVVNTLAQLEAHSAYNPLLAALEDEDSRVRQGSIAALSELGDRQVLPFLRKRLLLDPDIGVKAEASYRLGKLGDVDDLSTLQQSRDTDPNPFVHLWATWAIHNITPTPQE
ncbi:MAG: hypothetical protein GKS05_05105 [Nitrospirales bacterium]|nr:hypothetical protein [Nitrospirales bacterium]